MARKILVFAFFIEILSATYMLNFKWLIPLASILYFISGIAVGIAVLYLPQSSLKLSGTFLKGSLNGYKTIMLLALGILMYYLGDNFINDYYLDYCVVDMLPIIRAMCQRFIAGNISHVYDAIPEIWNGIHPIYLPAMWLPFCLPQGLHIDIRWMTIGALFFSFSSGLFLWDSHANRKLSYVYLTATLLLFFWLFANNMPGLIPYTEEGVVILYYVLLTLAILNGNYVLIGIAASLCVLSRYSLVGWLPAALILLALQKKWKQLIQFTTTGAACFVMLALIPFGWKQIVNFISLPTSYITSTAEIWQLKPWLFDISLGFGKFFGASRAILMHYLLITFSFIVPLAMVCFLYWNNFRKQKNYQNISLATLKIVLTVFYNLIDVPYLYLFYTPLFVSFIIVSFFLSANKSAN